MMAFLYVCIVLFSVMQSAAAKFYNRKSNDAMAFNLFKALSAFLLFTAAGVLTSGLTFHAGTAVYGTLYGIMLCVSMYSGYKALVLGPMAITSLVVSFSVVIPLCYGILFCDEKLTVFKMIGLAFLVVSIFFANINKSHASNERKKDFRWGVYVALTFLTNGFCSVVQKIHQTKYKEMYCIEFMLSAMLFGCIVFIVINLKRNGLKNIIGQRGKGYAVMSGISNAIAGYGTIRLAGLENASVLFPAISAGTILCTLLCGLILFGEKLKINHFIAVLGGIAAVVFLKI